jgi:hypothetical protein
VRRIIATLRLKLNGFGYVKRPSTLSPSNTIAHSAKLRHEHAAIFKPVSKQASKIAKPCVIRAYRPSMSYASPAQFDIVPFGVSVKVGDRQFQTDPWRARHSRKAQSSSAHVHLYCDKLLVTDHAGLI